LWGEGYGADEGPDAVLAPSSVVPGFIMRLGSVVQWPCFLCVLCALCGD
jgi:hypothetical protein